MRIAIACCALLLAGCASPAGGGRSGGASGGAGAPGTASHPGNGSGTGTASRPGNGSGTGTASHPGGPVERIYFNPAAVTFAAQPGVVLRSDADVARFTAWARSGRGPGSDGGVVAALRRPPAGERAVVVFGRSVGCDSIAGVSLTRHGHDLRLVPSGVIHRPECFRENWLVAAYAVAGGDVPADVTLDGRRPSTDWR